MNATSILLLAFAMSTDAFAAAVGKGSALHKPKWSEALRTGAIFGIIETLTPLIGWAVGSAAADYVKDWDHWIAFVLLLALGGKMLIEAFSKSDGEETSKPARHGFWILVATGFATSIDAMAVGVGLAFLNVDVTTIALAIGFTTFAMVTLGVMVGRAVGKFAGRWAEALGGVLLIGIGSLILFEHLTNV